MIIYILNTNAILAICIGVLCAFGGYAATHRGAVAAVAGPLGATVFDLFIRLRSEEESTPLLHPNAGGHVWFAPIWTIGIVVIGIEGLMWLGWV